MLEISQKDIVARLQFDNPWWAGGAKGKVAFENASRRMYFEAFHRSITDVTVRRAIVLMGPRRIGKTVMVYHSVRALLDA